MGPRGFGHVRLGGARLSRKSRSELRINLVTESEITPGVLLQLQVRVDGSGVGPITPTPFSRNKIRFTQKRLTSTKEKNKDVHDPGGCIKFRF